MVGPVPWRPSSFTNRLGNGNRVPWSQAATTSGVNEVLGPLRSLPRPTYILWRPWQRILHGHTCLIRGDTMNVTPHLTLLGAPNHGRPGGAILRSPVQEILQGSSERPTLSHHFQYWGRYSDQALIEGGHGVGGITRRVWDSGSASSSVVLWGRSCTHFPSYSTAPGSSRLSGRAIWPGRIEDQHGKNDGNDLPAILHGLLTLGGGLQAENDKRRTSMLGPPKWEVPLHGLIPGPDIHITGGAPSVPERDCLKFTVEEHPASGGTQLYQLSFPNTLVSVEFNIKGYRGQSTSCTNLWINSMQCHAWDVVVILEVVNHPHIRLPNCYMFVHWLVLNKRHPETALCIRGSERKWHNLVDKE